MVVGQKRGSRPAGGKSQTVRDGDERQMRGKEGRRA
jgi:hypothetical protein